MEFAKLVRLMIEKLPLMKLLMFAGTTTPEPGEVKAEMVATPKLVKTKLLLIPGGPLPPVELFVQFKIVDQFVSAPPRVQRSVPGFAVAPLIASVTAVFRIKAPLVALMVS